MIRAAMIAMLSLSVGGCFEDAVVEKPDPVAMTAEAVGHYCQMNVLEHEGPKAQIHLAGLLAPLWFSQVRDAVVYTRLPEETAEITAIYVNDMGRAKSWAEPGDANWVDADEAYFVIDSRQTGGMGVPETIPFGVRSAAETFVSQHGGKIVRFAEIPEDYVLSPVDTASSGEPGVPAQ
ncbi:nitrous oxide reductase accessory protein NosL [Microbaculum sp. FT89]|uniref:nitrous oxide reductase accessory protein NosL n=1 Tax=Microbaculum sp. FT89 TaxID=3447298 RepID=UPI003F537BB4